MHKNPSNLDTCEISPVRASTKHQVTPHRTRRKTSRRDQCIDVHTSCSTPTYSPGIVTSSPSSSFPYSQENCPDVVWDYTSPKLPRGGRKKEIKLTVKELLENLNQCQVPESNTQSAQYIKLLENYMAKQGVPTNVKKPGRCTKSKRQPQAHVLEELKKFLETIPRQKKEPESNSRTKVTTETRQDQTDAANNSKLNMSAKSFLDGESSECDSTDELWGEPDNSFIVKATQELESINPTQTNSTSQDGVSTIPETNLIPKTPVRKSSRLASSENKVNIDVETYNDLLEQLTNVDWDSVDYDEWDNGFIEDDALSLIPDDVLNGNEVADEGTAATQPSAVILGTFSEDTGMYSATAESKPNTAVLGTYSGDTVIYSAKESTGLSKPSEVNTAVQSTFSGDTVIYSVRGSTEGDLSKSVELFDNELYNSFEDESFEDESLLCQPDVLSRIDEVENMMSQQPKCTPEEIEKKKDDAMKRRQKRP